MKTITLNITKQGIEIPKIQIPSYDEVLVKEKDKVVCKPANDLQDLIFKQKSVKRNRN